MLLEEGEVGPLVDGARVDGVGDGEVDQLAAIIINRAITN